MISIHRLGLTTWMAVAFLGCSVDGDDATCGVDFDCAPGYYCDFATGSCHKAVQCASPEDCTGTNETCSSDATCKVGSCQVVGCVQGYTCSISNGAWACSQDSSQASAGAAGSQAGALGEAGSASTLAGSAGSETAGSTM